MKKYQFFLAGLFIFLFSCKPVENILLVNEYSEINAKVLENPKRFIGKELNFLLTNLKMNFSDYSFGTARHFILEGLYFSFGKDIKINILFNWKNSDFDYRGGFQTQNTWDFDALKKEKIRAIIIYVNKEEVYSVK